MSRSYVYGCWQAMIDRCTRPSHPAYVRYRSLELCPEWRENFATFYTHVGDPPSVRHTLDRKDNEIGYVPGNIRWATRMEQANNRRNNRVLHFNGHDATLSEWSRRQGLGKSTIRERLRRGWPVERALTELPQA